MIDHEGVEWLTIAQVRERWPHIAPATVRQWRARGHVRAHLIGRRLYVHVGDVLDAERAARRTGWRAGRRPADLSH